MIEVVHFQNRFGKRVVYILGVNSLYCGPEQVRYNQRYAAGLEAPEYPVPVSIEYSHAFAIRHCLQLIAEIWSDQSYGGDHA